MGKTQRYLYHNLVCFSSFKYYQNVTQVPSIKRVVKAHRKSSCFLIRLKTLQTTTSFLKKKMRRSINVLVSKLYSNVKCLEIY